MVRGKIMKATILPILFIMLSPIAIAENLSYGILLHYESKDGTFSITNISLIKVPSLDRRSVGAYKIGLYSFEGRPLYDTNFDIDTFVYDSDIIIEELDKKLFLPYFTNGAKLKILERNLTRDVIRHERDISSFATCNENKVCDDKETHELCPEECLCGNGKCDKGETYETCTPDCPRESTRNMGFWQKLWYRISAFFTSIF